MDKDLLNKEVLCIIDTRQIQRYLFRTNTYEDTIGASDLVAIILPTAIKYAVKNIDVPLAGDEYDLSSHPDDDISYFSSDKIKFQIITCSAGNALCIVRTGALCQKIIRKISRYYLESGYSLNVTSAVCEKTNNFGYDIFCLYKKLNAVKASSDISNPLEPLAIVERENMTGDNVVGIDKISGDHISMGSKIKRLKAHERKNYADISEISSTKIFDGHYYKAAIHADGNNLGITIGKIIQQTASYKEGIYIRRKINKNIEDSYAKAIDESITHLKDYYVSMSENTYGFEKEFCLVHHGGDDINIICNANLAIPFVSFLYKSLKNRYIWNTPSFKVPLYVCTGIAFANEKVNFHQMYSFAEDCCESAKIVAKNEKNLKNGLATSWIDFQIFNDSRLQSLSLLRKIPYTTKENIDLLLRPYCVDESREDAVYSYKNLLRRIENFRKLHFNAHQKEMMRLSYGIGQDMLLAWERSMKRKGIDIRASLGNPLYEEEGQPAKSVWFDVAELSNFVSEG